MKGIFVSLASALIIISVLFYSLYATVNDTAREETAKQPKYHVQVITQNTDEHFWTMFKKGASAAGNNFNTYVEFVNIAQKDADSSVQTIEKAISAKVDGIAFQAQDIKKTSAVLQTVKKSKIAAVTFENDLGYISDIPTIGSNNYNIGKKAGKMGVEACDGKGNVVVIINGTKEEYNQYKNLKLQGIIDAFSNYPNMKVESVYKLNSGLFETEKIMRKILDQNPKTNMIICTDERSTPGVAQAIVDTNRVGDISIIGYGAMPQTLKYIESRGVIYGSICPDAYNIGYHTVEQLCSILDGKQVSESLDTELFLINKSNVNEFMVKDDEK